MQQRVWVLDASVVIDFKTRISVQSQWSFLRCLELMVNTGLAYITEDVVREVGDGDYPDAPGAWVYGVRDGVQVGYHPSREVLDFVLSLAADVVDPDDPEDDADPSVIAQAVELSREGRYPVVVTKDRRDRQDHVSMRTACDRFGIQTCSLDEFVAEIDCDAGELKPEA